jgi:zinc protease
VETVPPEALALALWLESDRMGFGGERLDEGLVSRESVLLRHEYRLEVHDTPFGLIQEWLSNELFPPWHPYHTPTDGLGVVGSPGVRDVRAFLRSWYTASNAVLVVAGRFDRASARESIQNDFGRLPANAPPVRPVLPAAPDAGDFVLEADSAVDIDRTVVTEWRTPGWHEPGDRELDVAAMLLADDKGLLRRSLVDTGEAVLVSARQGSQLRGSIFRVGVQVRSDRSVEPIQGAIDEAIDKLAARVDASDVARVRETLRRRAMQQLETSLGRASQLADDDASDPWGLRTYATIDSASVSAAVRRFLVPPMRLAAVVDPTRMPLPLGLVAVIRSRERRLVP